MAGPVLLLCFQSSRKQRCRVQLADPQEFTPLKEASTLRGRHEKFTSQLQEGRCRAALLLRTFVPAIRARYTNKMEMTDGEG